MKKLLIGIVLLNASSVYAMQEQSLALEDAKKLYNERMKNYSSESSFNYEAYKQTALEVIPVFVAHEVTFQDEESDPLRYAVGRKDIEFIKFLINFGADPDFYKEGVGSAQSILSMKVGIFGSTPFYDEVQKLFTQAKEERLLKGSSSE